MIFVDTSFWAALGNAGDARHGTAEEVVGNKPPVVMTSNHVPGRDLDAAQPALRSPRGGCRHYNPLEHRRSRRARNGDLERAGMNGLYATTSGVLVRRCPASR